MKILVSLVLVSMIAGSQSSLLDDIIKQMVDKMRPDLVDLQIPHIGLNPDNFIDSITVHNLENIELFTSSTIIPAIFHEISLTLSINLEGVYQFKDLTLLDMELFGGGKLDITVNNLQVHMMEAKLERCSDNNCDGFKSAYCLKNIGTTSVSLDSTKIYLEDIMGGGAVSDLINNLISNALPDLITAAAPDILAQPEVQDQVLNVINTLLKSVCI